MGLYDTTTLLKGVKQINPVGSFLRDTFFPAGNDQTFVTDTVTIDSKKGKRKLAPFVAPKVGGFTVDREGYITSTIKAPTIAPQRVMNLEHIMQRSFGESLVSPLTPEQRAARLLGEDLADLNEMIDRREEWAVAQLLFTGKINIKGYIDYDGKNTVDQVIDYKKEDIKTAAKTWDAAGSSPLSDIRALRTKVMKDSGVSPTICLMDSATFSLFINNEEVQKILNIINYNVGEIAPKIMNQGAVTFCGRFPSLGLDIYTYDEWYLDEEEHEKPLITEGHILVAGRNVGGFKYGAVTQLENGTFKTYEAKRVPKSWENEADDIRMIRLASKPVPVPYNVDSWAVLKVIK